MQSRGSLAEVAWVVLAATLCAICRPGEAAVYVVDQAAPGAADDSPGTEEKPFKTVQRAADAAQAGDTVYVMEGNYPERVAIKASGAEGKPIAFRAMPRGGETVEGFLIGDQAYLAIDGFKVFQPRPKVHVYGIDMGKAAHHIDISHCLFQSLYTGLWGAGNDGHVSFCRFYRVQYGSVCTGQRWVIENCDYERMYYFDGNGGLADCDYSRMWGKGHVVRFNHYHDTLRKEVGQAHLDVLQSFNLSKDNPEGGLKDLTFEDNVCSSFSQCFMVSTSTPGAMARMTFRRNIIWKGLNWDGGASALSLTPVDNAEVTNNTIAIIVWQGMRNTQGKDGAMSNNLLARLGIPYEKNASLVGHRNLVWDCNTAVRNPGPDEVITGDPKFADANMGNFRLLAGSAAIGAGVGGVTVGALEYPNVYYVDPAHPGASDEGYGYAGWPFKTAAKALAVAQKGETVILRGGVYRETLKPPNDGVIVRAMRGEKVFLSGADLIEGWRKTDKGWAAPLAAAPKKVLCDGKPFTDFAYTAYASRTATNLIILTAGGDPRLHVFETVVRAKGIDLAGRKDVIVEGAEAVNTLGEQAGGGAK